MIFCPADNDNLGPAEMAEMAETTNEREQSYTCIDFVERGGGRRSQILISKWLAQRETCRMAGVALSVISAISAGNNKNSRFCVR